MVMDVVGMSNRCSVGCRHEIDSKNRIVGVEMTMDRSEGGSECSSLYIVFFQDDNNGITKQIVATIRKDRRNEGDRKVVW